MSAVRRLLHTARALALPEEPIQPETDTQRVQRLETAIRLRRTCGVELGTVEHEEVLLFREKITNLNDTHPTIMTGIRLASGAQYEMTGDWDTLRSGSSDCRMTRDTLRCLGRMYEACMGNQRRNYGGQRKGIFNSYGFGMIKGPAMQILVSPDDRTRKDEARELMPLCRARSVDAASIRDLIPDIEISNAVVIHGTETQSVGDDAAGHDVSFLTLSAYQKKSLVGPMWSCPLEGGMTRQKTGSSPWRTCARRMSATQVCGGKAKKGGGGACVGWSWVSSGKTCATKPKNPRRARKSERAQAYDLQQLGWRRPLRSHVNAKSAYHDSIYERNRLIAAAVSVAHWQARPDPERDVSRKKNGDLYTSRFAASFMFIVPNALGLFVRPANNDPRNNLDPVYDTPGYRAISRTVLLVFVIYSERSALRPPTWL
ncbi:hypothetical protein EDB86DRAFT_3241789 [Lactarius hatsudake]|nr:hypothetical protein EDB86DRAFT_3241789 [Lactarius hatsudake]